jgi:hypothetical protein
MHACACLCALVHKAHAHCDCCDVMHACGGLCFLVHKADGDCEYCEARCMRVLVCVFLCTRRMLNVIAVRHDAWSCLFVWSCAQGACSCVVAARRCMRVLACVLLCTRRMDTDYCEAMLACVGVCVWACARRMVTVILLAFLQFMLFIVVCPVRPSVSVL